MAQLGISTHFTATLVWLAPFGLSGGHFEAIRTRPGSNHPDAGTHTLHTFTHTPHCKAEIDIAFGLCKQTLVRHPKLYCCLRLQAERTNDVALPATPGSSWRPSATHAYA